LKYTLFLFLFHFNSFAGYIAYENIFNLEKKVIFSGTIIIKIRDSSDFKLFSLKIMIISFKAKLNNNYGPWKIFLKIPQGVYLIYNLSDF